MKSAIFKSFLCGMAFMAGAFAVAAVGTIFTTTVGAGAFRPDAQVEVQGTDGLISLAQTQNPGAVNSKETAVVYSAYDSAGNKAKTGSISSKWSSIVGGVATGILRFNAAYSSGAGDDVAMRIYGNKGIALWNLTDSETCAYQALCLTGVLKLENPRVTAEPKSLFSWNNCLYWRNMSGADTQIAC